ncbi:MAG: peptidylprolyl isomerase [Candidatus Omnitrophica bacterium]|nr:peptidylprolyl isomerase [Candidatus Omnitrophota bacterium]
MRGRNVGLLAAVGVICAFVWAVSVNAASSKSVAKVNGEAINEKTLDAAMANFIENQKMFGHEIKEEDKSELRANILQELISAELIYQESKKAKLRDIGKEVDDQFENIKKGLGSDEEFKKVLEDRGIIEKDLKEDIKKGISIKKFLDEKVYSDIKVSEEEKKEEYEKNKDRLDVPEQVKASHILVRVKEDASDEDKKAAREKIGELRKRVASGEDFAEVAKENSEDGSAPRGGDLGYFGRGQMVKPFEDAAFSMEIGDISPVVETQFGCHILKVTDKKAPHLLTYAEVEKEIVAFLLNKHKKEKLDSLIEDLKKKAKIKID